MAVRLEDGAARVAGVNRGLEGLACDVFNQLVHIARKMGDPILERAVDFVLADEITHVRTGSKRLTKLTEGDPGAAAPGDRVPGDHRRALQPGRGPAGRAHTRCRSPSPARPASSAGSRTRRSSGSSRRHSARRSISAPSAGPRGPHKQAVARIRWGFSSADESARLIRNYRYAVERRCASSAAGSRSRRRSRRSSSRPPRLGHTQHADALGKRLPELRAPAHTSEPPNAAFAAFMDAVEEPEPPSDRRALVGIYRVLKPHLLATYEDHLRRINTVYRRPGNGSTRSRDRRGWPVPPRLVDQGDPGPTKWSRV